jgi:hypothetical protein
MQYLLTAEKVKTKEEAFECTSHHADIITYTIGKEVIQIDYDQTQS